MVDGFLCQKNRLHFTLQWQPTLLCLARETTIAGRVFPSGTWYLNRPGKVYFTVIFPGNTGVQDYYCRGGGGPRGIQTSFYSTGQLRTFFGWGDVEIKTLKLKGNVFNYLTLHKNGNLKSGKLSEDARIGNKYLKKGSFIELDSFGNLVNHKQALHSEFFVHRK